MTTPGTVIPAGSPTPPTTHHKAQAAFLYGLLPVILGAVVEVLQNATTLFSGAPGWVLTTCAVLLILLGPVASYWGTFRTPNRLLLPITIGEPQ